MRGLRQGIFSLLVLLALALPASALGAAPANDLFADRQVLPAGFPGGEPIEVTGSNVDAMKEEDEFIPGSSPAGHSVWFEWEAANDGWVTIGVCDNEFPTVLAVFTGLAINSLTQVGGTNDTEGPDCPFEGRQYTFSAVAGTKYVIAVDGNVFHLPESPPPVTEGAIELRIEETPVPPNDEFENATEIAGNITEEPGGNRSYFANTRGYNWTASNEHGEPDELTTGASVWYTWTAPESATYSFGPPCCQGAGALKLDLYTGGAVDELTPVAVGGGFSKVTLAAGQTLRIRVSGAIDMETEEPAVASFAFNLFAELAPLESPSPSQSGDGSSTAPTAPISPPDTKAPQTTISKRYLAVGTAKFWFGSSEPGSFLCRLDKGPFKPCGSPRAYKGLKSGRHTFKVKAVDAAGNVDPTPATAHFKLAPSPQRSR